MVASGDKAPEFELPGAVGHSLRLASLLDRAPVVLAFFKVSCPVCQYTLPFLQRIAGSAAVLGVSQNDARETAAFCREFGITFPVALDPEGNYPVSNAYRITNVPSIFLVGQDGTVEVSGSGFSRGDLEAIASRFGTEVFREGERVPEFRPG
jgi:peroxiredoxin